MKFQVGDLVLLKECKYKSRLRLPSSLHLHPRLDLDYHSHLKNTYGIITKIEKHSDFFEKDSTAADNGYMWFSQVSAKEYHFYENEVTGEIIK